MSDRFRMAATLALLLSAIEGCGPTPPSIVERAPLKGHTREIVSISFAPDGKTLASRGADAIRLWDVARGVEALALPSDGSDFGSVVFAPDGSAVVSERIGSGAVAWDLAGRERATYLFPQIKTPTPSVSTTKGWGLAFSPDGKSLAGGGSHGGDDGFLALWGIDGGEGRAFDPIRRPVTTVAFSPDGKTIATGSMDGKLVLWDVATRRERIQIAANRSYLAPVVFSPDGQFVASANEARWVKLWDAATGREVASLKGHVKAVLSLAFHPGGKALASGDSEGTLFVWDIPSLTMASRLESKDRGKVWGLAFSPDGKVLASCGEDRLIHLFDILWPTSITKDR